MKGEDWAYGADVLEGAGVTVVGVNSTDVPSLSAAFASRSSLDIDVSLALAGALFWTGQR